MGTGLEYEYYLDFEGDLWVRRVQDEYWFCPLEYHKTDYRDFKPYSKLAPKPADKKLAAGGVISPGGTVLGTSTGPATIGGASGVGVPHIASNTGWTMKNNIVSDGIAGEKLLKALRDAAANGQLGGF